METIYCIIYHCLYRQTDTQLAEGQCFSLPSHRFRIGIRRPLDVKGIDVSKPGDINKNTSKYNASSYYPTNVENTVSS